MPRRALSWLFTTSLLHNPSKVCLKSYTRVCYTWWIGLRHYRNTGAKAYYLHSVLHDGDDASCLKILNNIVPAMSPGYSKLLINENVVPDSGAAWPITSMDWLMMALVAVKERTEKEWRGLLQQAGLEVTGIWTYEQGTESLIEAEVAV